MKKYFGIVLALATVMVILPLKVFAASPSLTFTNCTMDGDVRTCTGVLTVDAGSEVPSVTVTFTEVGKADILSVLAASGVEIVSQNEDTHTYTFSFTQAGEFDLLTISYNTAGDANDECKITYTLDGGSTTTIPGDSSTDTTTENKQTGSTLPYIAIGGILLVAIGAYVATKNKSKMYKI